jgi:hypothetical protein
MKTALTNLIADPKPHRKTSGSKRPAPTGKRINILIGSEEMENLQKLNLELGGTTPITQLVRIACRTANPSKKVLASIALEVAEQYKTGKKQ